MTPAASVLAVHHGYRVAGGEEEAAERLARLAESQLGERVAWLRRDSSDLGAALAARGLLAGGTDGDEVARAVGDCGADLVHAHNLFPTFGPAALRAAREAGAAVVVHLHNYRLACAVATTVRDGRDCTSCRYRWPVPGLVHRCRGSLPEAAAYAAALPRWSAAVLRLADAVVVPSRAALDRLLELGLPLDERRVHVVGGVAERVATGSGASKGRYALVVSRLAPEKDLATAIAATAGLGLPLVIAGDGPERRALADLAERAGADAGQEDAFQQAAEATAESLRLDLARDLPTLEAARHGTTVFLGRVPRDALGGLRRGARVALVTSLAHETFGLAALESMADAVPTVGSAVGALPDLLGADAVAPPGDARTLALVAAAFEGRDDAGLAAAARAAELAAPARVAERLGAAYADARERRDARR